MVKVVVKFLQSVHSKVKAVAAIGTVLTVASAALQGVTDEATLVAAVLTIVTTAAGYLKSA